MNIGYLTIKIMNRAIKIMNGTMIVGCVTMKIMNHAIIIMNRSMNIGYPGRVLLWWLSPKYSHGATNNHY